MPLSTEIFVMCIFIAGLPFFYMLLKDMQLEGSFWFLWSYICLVLSNIFTVVEEFAFNYFFNICEHSFITLSSILLIIAIWRLSSSFEKSNVDLIEPEKKMNRRE